MRNKSWLIGIALTVGLLVVHLPLMDDYGLTWDFHHHFFAGAKFLGYQWWQIEPRPLPYVEPDPRYTWSLPYGPFISIIPTASYLLFHKTLGWLAADNAYHLPIVLVGVAGIGILYYFLKQAINPKVALLASLFLALTPRYFGDLHNNMKDVPNAAIFALNIWLIWRLVRFRRPLDLLWAAMALAIAFNVKVNSLYIPVIFAVWLALLWFSQRKKTTLKQLVINNWQLTTYFFLAPLLAFLLWWTFWGDPIGQLKHAYLTFGVGTDNIEVLLAGRWYCSGKNVPWYYPYWYLGITTPIPILLFFLVGVLFASWEGVRATILRSTEASPKSFLNRIKRFIGEASLSEARGILQKASISSRTSPKNALPEPHYATLALLIIWFFLPLTRYLIPKIGVIDGIRHFEEVLYPLSALAALGAIQVFKFFNNITIKQYNNRWRTNILIGAALGIFIHLLWNVISYHPFQITYFNELIGGVKGAFGRYDLDYWGTSQKQAVAWVNEQAPEGAKVHIVMAAAVAGGYLRPDLLPNLNKYWYDNSDFVIVLDRQSFFYRFFYAYEYLLHHKPTQTIAVKGVPLVWIYDNRATNRTPRQTPWWQAEDPCIIKYWGENTSSTSL